MTRLGTVLVVEDDPAIGRGVSDALTASGYRAVLAADGPAGIEAALGGAPDLVLLDLMLPGCDGLEVLRRVRAEKPGLPVIILTARGEESDRVTGLRLGADDYVIKPFGVAELLARVEAVLRRSAERPKAIAGLRIGDRRIDLERARVHFSDGRTAELSPREAEVLGYLAAHRGRIISRDELLDRVWGVDPRGSSTRTVDMAIARIREHLDDDPASPEVIRTVRGRGYELVGAETA
ncbi:MAG: response regulator transcription factor [Phycisphaerales bacterium]